MCVSQCIIAPMAISGQYYMLTFQLFPVQMLFSKPCAFTKQARAAAAWQCCREKLFIGNCSTEEAVHTETVSSTTSLPLQSTQSYSPRGTCPVSFFTEQVSCSLAFQLLILPHGLEIKRQFLPFPSLPSHSSLAVKCWVLGI